MTIFSKWLSTAPMEESALYGHDSEFDDIKNTEDALILARGAAHYDGYVREAALRRCLILARGDLLPIAISRLNDWVPVVREVARAGVMAILPAASPADIIHSFAAIEQLRAARREDHSQWIGEYEAAAIGHVPLADLMTATASANHVVARACLRLLKSHQLIDLATLVNLSFARETDVVSVRNAIALSARLPAPERLKHYEMALDSRLGAARIMALRCLLADQDTPDAQTIAFAHIMDGQAAVRDAAHFYLQQRGVALQSHYRQFLAPGAGSETVQSALLGLAKCVGPGDIDLIRGFILSPRPAVRIAAFAGWMKAAPASKDEIAGLALNDRSAKARRLAILMIRRHHAFVPRNHILDTLQKTGDFRLLDLIVCASVWTWLALVCKVLQSTSVTEAARRIVATQAARRIDAPDGRFNRPVAEELDYLLAPPTQMALEALLSDNPTRFRALRAELELLRG